MKVINLQESGRSMIPVLAVLVLVIMAGNKLINRSHKTRIYAEAFNILTMAQVNSCRYKDSYGSYANMLAPDIRLAYRNDTFWGFDGIKYKFIENSVNHFTLQISQLSRKNCLNLASVAWWRKDSAGNPVHGYPEISINKSGIFSLLTAEGANKYCHDGNDNVIEIGSAGCKKFNKQQH